VRPVKQRKLSRCALVAEDHMYLVVCEFLLLKPSLDVTNVPEFYKLFYSARLEVVI